MTAYEQNYLSYLLRLWLTNSNGEQIWRASLEIPGTGERRGFTCLEELFIFLEAQTNRSPRPDRSSPNDQGRGGDSDSPLK